MTLRELLDFLGEDICIVGGFANPRTPIEVDGRLSVFRYAWDYWKHMEKKQVLSDLEIEWKKRKDDRARAIERGVPAERAVKEYTEQEKKAQFKSETAKALNKLVTRILRGVEDAVAPSSTSAQQLYKTLLSSGFKGYIRTNVFCVKGVPTFRIACSDEIHAPREETKTYEYAVTKFTVKNDLNFFTSGLKAFDALCPPAQRRKDEEARKQAFAEAGFNYIH